MSEMESLSFDPMVELYEVTRACDPACLSGALDWVAAHFPPASFPNLFEPGIGTGRIAIPLAERGYSIAGIDIAQDMLAVLERRVRETLLPITWQVGDATSVPCGDNTFDLSLACHLFYFIPEWRRAVDEMLRVTHAGGAIILVKTGYGKEVPFLTERYRALRKELGAAPGPRGAAGTKEVVAYAESKGCAAEWITGRWQWGTRQRVREALSYYERRAYSYTSTPSPEAHAAIIRDLTAEAVAHYGNLEAEVAVPDEIYLVILRQEQ